MRTDERIVCVSPENVQLNLYYVELPISRSLNLQYAVLAIA